MIWLRGCCLLKSVCLVEQERALSWVSWEKDGKKMNPHSRGMKKCATPPDGGGNLKAGKAHP